MVWSYGRRGGSPLDSSSSNIWKKSWNSVGTFSFQSVFFVDSPRAALISYKERAPVITPVFLLFLRKAAAPIVWMGGVDIPLIMEGEGEGRHSFLQRGELNVTVLDAN